jgi:hypothetical protein
MPASSESPSNANGSGPDHGSPVWTVVAPVRVAGAGAGATVVGGGVVTGVAAGGAVTAAVAVAAPSTSTMPPEPIPGAPCATAMSTPAALAVPWAAVDEGAPTDTVVCSGVPVRKLCDAPGVTDTVLEAPVGGARVTVTAPAVAVAPGLPDARSALAVVPARPTVTVSRAPPPAPTPFSRCSVAPVLVEVAVTVDPVEVTVVVDGPIDADTSEVTLELDADATCWSTVPRGSPPVGSVGRVPRTVWSFWARPLLGSTDVGSRLFRADVTVPPGGGPTVSDPTLPLAVAAGVPVGRMVADAAPQARPRDTDVPSGAGNGLVGWAQARGCVCVAPGLAAVACAVATAWGETSPWPLAVTGAPVPADAEEAPPTKVVPPRRSSIPEPAAVTR